MNKVLFSLIGFFAVTSAYAVTGTDAKDYLKYWGGGSFDPCGSHAFVDSEMCIGTNKNCEVPLFGTNGDVTANNNLIYTRNPTDKDEYALQLMVAIDINEHGARFCPIQVEAKNKDKGDAWIEYAMIGNTTGCQWLCKDGYSGDKCMTAPAEITRCNPVEFKRDNYNSLPGASGASIASDIALFTWNARYGCGLNKRQEHDSVLAITRWAPGGHGAWVQPVIVRAQRKGWDSMTSWPAIYSRAGSTAPQLVCVEGYAPNTAQTDCLQINSTLCDRVNCPDLAKHGYVGTIHTEYMPAGAECPDFRCKNNNQAFASITDKTCVSCPSSMRGGVSPIDGTCVSCELGTVFNGRATDSEHLCKPAIRLTKTDMQYGFGYTKNSRPDVADQCWSLGQIDEYRACVLASVSSATNNPAVPARQKKPTTPAGELSGSISSLPTLR